MTPAVAAQAARHEDDMIESQVGDKRGVHWTEGENFSSDDSPYHTSLQSTNTKPFLSQSLIEDEPVLLFCAHSLSFT